MTASIHPVAVPAHKPTRPEHQSVMDHAGRPDRIDALKADLHADIDFYQQESDAEALAAARRLLTEFRPYDVAGWLADMHDVRHTEGATK